MWQDIAFFIAGIICGFMNSLASSGSAFTLPLFPILGISPTIGNATNRILIFASSLMSTYMYSKAGRIHWPTAFKLLGPVLFGALVGSRFAADLSPHVIAWVVVAAVIIAIIIVSLNPQKILSQRTEALKSLDWKIYLVFTLIGFWSGFIVLDSASWLLFALVLMCGFDLICANGLKNFFCLVGSIVSIVVFGFSGQIYWMIGILMAIGGILGAWIGSKLGVQEKYRIWSFRILLIALVCEVVIMAIRIMYVPV